MSEYSKSPIREGEFYYCAFRNDEWHMSLDGIREWHEFYLSSKLGPVEYGISANSFMGFNEDPKEMTLAVPQFPLVHTDGSELSHGTHGCDIYKVFIDSKKSLFLKINDSPLKSIYQTNPPNTVGDKDYFLKIEHLRGYGNEQKCNNIISAVESRLNKAGIMVPKIPWHRFSN